MSAQPPIAAITARSQSGCAVIAASMNGASASDSAGGVAPAIAMGSAPDAPGLKWRTTPTTHNTIAAAAPAALPVSQSAIGCGAENAPPPNNPADSAAAT